MDDLLTLVLVERVILVHAPSGTGKSSLINAGLVPRVRAEGFDVLPIARVRVPGAVPAMIDNQYNRFVDNVVANWRSDARFSEVPARASLVATLASLGASPEPGRLLVFDQFEELFVMHPERWKDRADLIREVQQAIDEDPLLRVLLVLRDDYLAHLERYAPLLRNRLRARYALGGLDRSQAVAATIQPFALAGLSLEADAGKLLVEKLLHLPAVDMEGLYEREHVEPLQLQIVCSEFFDLVASRSTDSELITKEDVASMVDVERALSRFYDTAVAGAIRGHRTVSERRARLWLERKLVTQDRSRNLIRRGDQKTEGLPNDVVDDLSRLGLLREEPRGRDRWYELSHDRLVDAIISSNRAFLGTRNRRRMMWGAVTSGVTVTTLIAVLLLSGVGASRTGGSRDYRDTISQSSQVIPFTFEGEQGQLLTAVLFIGSDSDLIGHISLIDPNHEVVVESKSGFKRPSLSAPLTSSGSYRLDVSGLGGTTGEFTLDIRIERIGGESQTIQPGTRQDGSLARSEEVDGFRFEGKRGSIAVLTVLAPSVDAFLTLVTPGLDHLFVDAGGGDRDAALVVQLPDDGAYEARVSSLTQGKGSYTFGLEFVEVPQLSDSAIDTLDRRNKVNVYSLSSDTDGLRMIELRSEDGVEGSMQLFSEGGEELVRSGIGDRGKPMLTYPLIAGARYFLTVAGNKGKFGSYHLSSQTMAAWELSSPGASGQLDQLHSIEIYRVTGEAGATFTLRAVPAEALNISMELFQPDGTLLLSRDRAGVGQEEFIGDRFPATGIYLVKVSTSRGGIGGKYELDYLVSSPGMPRRS